MKSKQMTNLQTSRQQQRARGGWASGALVIGLVVLICLVVLGVSLAQMISTHQQLRIGCNAAALAGAAELMDRNVLYPDRALGSDDSHGNGKKSEHQLAGIRQRREEETARQIIRARQTAMEFAAANHAAAAPIDLDPNMDNQPDGDIVVGWLEPATLQGTLESWPASGLCNSMEVRAARTRQHGNALALWMGGWLGMPQADVTSAARATVDQHVYGFRPVGASNVPLVPFAMKLDGEGSWLEQASSIARPGKNDQFSVDTDLGRVTSGADGIPELELWVRLDEKKKSAATAASETNEPANEKPDAEKKPQEADRENTWPLVLTEQGSVPTMLLAGLDAEFLAGWGGQLELSGAAAAGLRISTAKPAFDDLVSQCMVIRGELRIWPLAESGGDQHGPKQPKHAARDGSEAETTETETTESGPDGEASEIGNREDRQQQDGTSGDGTGQQVVEFGAGCVVHAYAKQIGETRYAVIVVQPGLLETCTALVRPGERHNPWIGKLVLTH